MDTTSGDAVAGEILSGKKAYVDGSEVTGTMANNAGDTAATSNHASGTSIHVVPAAGYYDGSDDAATITDAEFLSTNIKNGVEIFGVTGVGAIDSYTKVLLHMDGANNGTTFTDQCGKTWTAAGTAITSTTAKAYGTASMYLDGNSDYISTDDSDDFYFSTGEWTIDFWIYFSTTADGSAHIIYNQYEDASNYTYIYFTGGYNQTTALYVEHKFGGSSIINSGATWNMAKATWHHIAVVRTGNVIRVFDNGAQKGSDIAANVTFGNIAGGVKIGCGNGAYYTNAFIDEFRVSKGVARWTSTFVPGSAYGGD